VSNNTETPKVKKEASTNIRGKSNSQPPHNHDINCFHCLGINHITFMCSNEKAMVFHDHRKVKIKVTSMMRRCRHLRLLMIMR
jgi:hypothetical protein